MSTSLKVPHGDKPVLHAIPAPASNVKVPVAVLPSDSVTPDRSQTTGLTGPCTTEATSPAVLTRDGAAGESHAASLQDASWMAPTERLLLLTLMTPPPSVNPAGGVPPTPV